MLSFPPSVGIYLAAGVTDMRKSFDTLAQLAKDALQEDPLSGNLFVFCNRRRNRLKILVWDRSGFWLCAKRLEEGTFTWPEIREGFSPSVEMTSDELTLLLSGIDLRFTTQKKRYQRPPKRA